MGQRVPIPELGMRAKILNQYVEGKAANCETF